MRCQFQNFKKSASLSSKQLFCRHVIIMYHILGIGPFEYFLIQYNIDIYLRILTKLFTACLPAVLVLVKFVRSTSTSLVISSRLLFCRDIIIFSVSMLIGKHHQTRNKTTQVYKLKFSNLPIKTCSYMTKITNFLMKSGAKW